MNPSAIAGPSSEKQLQMSDISELLVHSSESGSDLSSHDEIEAGEEGRQEEILGIGSSSEDEEETYYPFGSEKWIPHAEPREAFSTFAEEELLVDFGEKPSALQIFEYVFDDELTKHITHQTNLFAEQSTREKRRSSLMNVEAETRIRRKYVCYRPYMVLKWSQYKPKERLLNLWDNLRRSTSVELRKQSLQENTCRKLPQTEAFSEREFTDKYEKTFNKKMHRLYQKRI
ncbi:uncharacterized protein LOC111626431 [Centruroides sculpturatus]|uniref:uncharacterized protein LOC111626431 n=1 Tax=Centruroides sculpturatus TaxID=218467 RepID=UPI000C6CACBB|nr:uncharacterized protein LOC111626431 [Centruroides sculpturatus]